MSLGATRREWQHFDLVLGLGADMLPVVPDPNAVPSPNTAITKFGKVPSAYDRMGNAHGLKDWQKRAITAPEIERWSNDERLGMCVRTGGTSGVYAIDVDIHDEDAAQEVENAIDVGFTLPRRERANSGKFLLAFRLPGIHKKRIINTANGRIEFLGEGQQFVAAGTHPSGARYVWSGGLPVELLERSVEWFEATWEVLGRKFAAEPQVAKPGDSTVPVPLKSPNLTTITPSDLEDLTHALAHPALVQAAGDNATWSEIGYALLSLGRDVGGVLFAGFSQFAPNYEVGAPEAWWAAHETQEPRSDYRHIFTMAKRLGWRTTAEAEDFPVVAEPLPAADDRVRPRVGQVPDARHLCTDQKNANRLQAAYRDRLICVGGAFYGWTGTHWRKDDGMASWAAAHLSKLVHEEMEGYKAKFEACAAQDPRLIKLQQTKRRDMNALQDELLASKQSAIGVAALASMEALQKWETACENATTQQRAVELLRKNLRVEPTALDSHAELITCLNGTIDLRTGVIRAHDPLDFITGCAPVNYDPEAACPAFEQFLRDILDDERAAFMQRYLGYSITGETREQKVMLHIGEGGNGKGTLFRLMKDVLGSEVYFHTAPEGLLTSLSNSERHPTEIAGLFGKRFVSAYESDENAVMREAFMKHLSGQDPISGRFMFKDFFTFMPVCKLHLQTNHEPQVRGTDHGMWRRLLLIKYGHKYGTQADVDAGLATRREDAGLTERLLAERAGIFAWLVRGAKAWYGNGLDIPRSIVEEVDRYRNEQDRMKQFVRARCTLDPNLWSAFGGAFGLYPAYVEWCRSQGFGSLSATKFSKELARAVPGFRRADQHVKMPTGKWKTTAGAFGVAVNVEETSDLL